MKKNLLAVVFVIFYYASVQSQVTLDGNITEPAWGTALGTSAGGPTPGFGAGHEINSLFAKVFTNSSLYIALGANVQEGHRILLFIDSRTGGHKTGNYGRDFAPQGLDDFNSGTNFDTGFEPDYCLVIGTNNSHDNFYFELFTLGGTVAAGGGQNKILGDINDPDLAASPANNSMTHGFECRLSISADGNGTDLQYTGGSIGLMAMYITENGSLSNQFISPAGNSEVNYGTGAIAFNATKPGFVDFSPNQLLPMQFLEIDSRVIQEESLIYWSVDADVDVAYYELEESTNGSVFNTLQVIPSMRNQTRTEYTVKDEKLNIGNNFYRIKAIGDNGTVITSKILRMAYGRIDNTLFVFPNPVKDQLNIQLHGILRGDYKLHVYNTAGQEIYSQKVNHDGADRTLQIKLPANLQHGVYRILFINKYEFYKQAFTIE